MDYNAIPDIMAAISINMNTMIYTTVITIIIVIYSSIQNMKNAKIIPAIIVGIIDIANAKAEKTIPIIAKVLDLLFFIAFTEIIRETILNINGIIEGRNGIKHKINAQIPKTSGSELPESFDFSSGSFTFIFFN